MWHFCRESDSRKIERVQEKGLRAIYKAKTETYEELLMRAELPSLRNRRMQDIMIYMYKVKHGLAPKHISDIFTVKATQYSLRNSDYLIPRFNKSKYKLATFAHQDIFSEGNTNKLLKQRNSVYSLRGSNKLILPRPRTDILRNSVTYRASTLWNNLKDCTTTVSDFNSFKKLVKEQLKSLTFLPNCGKNDDFIYF